MKEVLDERGLHVRGVLPRSLHRGLLQFRRLLLAGIRPGAVVSATVAATASPHRRCAVPSLRGAVASSL